MKISIAIPTYECNGMGWLFISELLNSIKKQSYRNYEVIISDQSNDNKTKRLIDFYSTEMNIHYINSTNIPRKIGTNLNNALKHCSGDIFKPMLADDFFIDDNALLKIVENFSDGKWTISGCMHGQSIHSLYQKMVPFYHDKIHLGANTISSPSVLSFKTDDLFDEKLSLLIDCEMYKRLYVKYGAPAIIADPLICNRVHKDQIQRKISSHSAEAEKEYCIRIYGE